MIKAYTARGFKSVGVDEAAEKGAERLPFTQQSGQGALPFMPTP